MYLPVTAVLGGRLFVAAEGYEEAVRDVVRLCADVAGLLEQQARRAPLRPPACASPAGAPSALQPVHGALSAPRVPPEP